MPHKIFISYSSSDQETADTICRHLEDQGIECWIAHRNIAPGQNFAAAIIDAINTSELLLVVFSSRLDRSNHAVREIERAVSKSLNILPVLIENATPTGSYEYLLCNLHWLNAYQPPFQDHLGAIVENVRLFLDPNNLGGNPFPPESKRFPEGSEFRFTLEIVAEDGRIDYSLPIEQPLLIGSSQADVVIPDSAVSRQHCRIYPSGNHITVQDLNSRNGVFRRIQGQIELRDQDEICIGNQIFRIEEIDD